MDGEARKWFRSLDPNSVTGIDELEEIFLKHWGDRKDYVYYLTEFGALKKNSYESLADFNKRFNKIYQNIPEEIKSTETTTMINFANYLDSKFALWLRAEKAHTLTTMQEATIGVQYNLMA